MAEREILIRKAALSDLDGIFYLYANYMFDSYLLKFGGSLVKKYLEIIISSRDCVTLVAEDNNVIGFIMATFNSKKILSQLFFNIDMLRLWGIQVLSRPCLTFASLELLLYPFKASLRDIDAELLFIAILPDYRKQGFASNLIAQVLDLMRQKNMAKVKVSTLAENRVVNTLLLKEGFRVERGFRLLKKHIYLYSFDLN